MTDERRIEYIPLAELLTRLHPRNPKQHDVGAIVQSYQHHGYVANGVLDSRTGLFLAGHGRVEALSMMQKQKMEAPRGIRNGGADWLVPVQVGYESDSDEAALAYLAADNKLTELGGWDEPALAELLQEIHNSGEIALEASGFDADDLDTLLNDLGMMEEPTPDPGGQVDRAAELQEKWQVKRGDVWQVGRHFVMCGDSTCAEDVDKLMGGVKADLCLTDPPYDISRQGTNLEGYNIDKGKAKEFKHFDEGFNPIEFLCLIPQMMSDNGNLLIFTGSYLLWKSYLPYLDSNYDIASFIVWIKPFAVNNIRGVGFAKSFETAAYAWNKGHYFEVGHGIDNYDVFQYSSNSGGRSYEHPTAKPIALFLRIIKQLSPENGNVVDSFLGSGTTIVACEQTGRIGYGMEIAPEYVAVTLQRLSDMGLQPKRVGDE
jgi:DNA modification methylase